MSDDTPSTNKQTIATVSALVLGVAGAAGWLKPPDTTAAAKTYDTTKQAIEVLEDKHDEDFDALDDRQREFEIWVSKRLAELDRDVIPEHRKPDAPTPDPQHWQPPPQPKRPPPRPAAAKLPTADDLFE